MRLWVLILWLLVLASASAVALNEPKRILFLNSYRGAVPTNKVFATRIREQLDLASKIPVEIDSDTLNLAAVHDEEYVRKLIETYRLKYDSYPPSLVVAVFRPAVELLLHHRSELFPGVPIVLCFTEYSQDDVEQLPPGVTGVATKIDFTGTLELMSQLQPDVKKIALIVGSSDVDAAREQEAREAFRPYESEFEFTWFRGLPLRELTEAVKALPSHAAILYLVQHTDREGLSYVPRNVVQAVAEAATVPVYGLWDTLIGAGIVGGRLISFEQQGIATGKIVRRILEGEAPEAISVVRMERNPAIVDAGQLKRWSIDERLLPDDSRILNREHSLWEEHRNAVLVAGGLIALQALWIAALLTNRKRLQRAQASLGEESDHRVQAEELTRRLRLRLGAVEKQSALGALAGGIAHEVNQPLIAIKNYAQAAHRYLRADSAHGGKLAELLSEMEGEAGRAGTIIRKIRKLLSSGNVEAVPVELDPVLREVIALMRPEAEAYGYRLDYPVTSPGPTVLADALQVQLVLVNLLRNALEATASRAQQGDGAVLIAFEETADQMVQVSVADCGPGVPANEVEDIFEPLYSAKEAGMGIGLATCRTIIEAHGGRIWCAPNPAGGAIFCFTLPIAGAGD